MLGHESKEAPGALRRYCGDGDARPSGFVLLAVSDYEGEIEYAIETTEAVVGCPDCGVLARLHDRRRTDVRDLPASGRPVTLV